MSVDWLGFGYAALVASGGIIGYAKAEPGIVAAVMPVWSLLLQKLPGCLSVGRTLKSIGSFAEVNGEITSISDCTDAAPPAAFYWLALPLGL
ncbi:uncharacterized protein LOC112953935 isoform X3 [Nothoprocta perdicaria]|uniref:uncharacterized protein LOC112953935 isoform X3 n=1 Tax=Nothoprocta perdicaria TaxID=30464 RepID=UPI000E1C2AC7|nr:uncharacterized protein LOC112953935 isoform X3 [Nothoprocta perdicaria]